MSDDAIKTQLLNLVREHAALDLSNVPDAAQHLAMGNHRDFAKEVLAASEAPNDVTWADQLHLQVTSHAHGVAVEGQVEGAGGGTQVRMPIDLKRTIAAEWLMTADECADLDAMGEEPSDSEIKSFMRKHDLQLSDGDMRRSLDQAATRGSRQ